MQFCWNLQLLILYPLFINLTCSTSNLLAVDADGIFVALNIFGVCRISSWYFKCLLTGEHIAGFFFKLSFILFMGRCFFLLVHFLVVEDYELPKSTSHILSVPLNLELVRILSYPSLFSPTLIFSVMMFCVRLLSELMIMLSTHYVRSHLACRSKL